MDTNTTHRSQDVFDIFLNILLKIAVAILGIVSFAFLVLPFIILPIVNKKLRGMPDFSGHIRSMRFNLFDASVSIKGLALMKKNNMIPVAFFTQDNMLLAIRIYKRRLLADITIDNFNVNLVKGAKEDDSQLNLDKAWLEMARKMMVLNINRLQIENGSTHFRTFHTAPQVDIYVDNMQLVLGNLNIRSSAVDPLPANIRMSANIHGGKLKLEGTLNPRNPIPTFDVNAELKGLHLEQINSALLAYADIDVTRGEFSMSAEVAAKEKKITGYVKPAITNLKLFNWKSDKRSSLKKIVKELFIDGVVALFKNQKKNQFATKILIDGEITGPDVKLWSIVGCMLFNAFVESLLPHIEDTITIDSVDNDNKDKACNG